MKICVIGGGAAGMTAAVHLARDAHEVVLLEKNEKLGKKLYITGKGRCNVTNDCQTSEFFRNIVHGEKFLRSAIYGFTPRDAMSFFEELGLKLVVERGNRVFPFSQKSSDVIKVLEHEMNRVGVEIRLNSEVKRISKSEDGFCVSTAHENVFCDRAVVATGGVSYPSTGSTGDGYAFAKKFGLSVVNPEPALSPILLAQSVVSLQGLSLKNVLLTAVDENGKEIASEFGEMLFTQKGISGPIALTVSSYINRRKNISLMLDLKPAIDEKTLDSRLLREFENRKNQDIKNVLRAVLPERLNIYVLGCADIDVNRKVNSLTKAERAKLVNTIKNLRFDAVGLASFNEAIITAGGVDVKELKPTCETKKVPGLYFIGETVDLDALTGGFNLQIAYATAVIAAKSITKENKSNLSEAL